MYLLLNASAKEGVRYLLWQDTHSIADETHLISNRETLQGLITILEKKAIPPDDIQGIAVVVGEGSFTSTRIATTIANAWRLVRQIPIIAVSVDESVDVSFLNRQFAEASPKYILARYRAEPNIGPPKDVFL